MKWLKKVAATPLSTIAKVIDSLEEQTNTRINAPSIHAVNEAINNNWLSIYPIGSIYINVNNINPSELFGGTWRQVKDTFLLASGDTYNNGSTGGTATNTLSVNQLPSHNHSYTRATGVGYHKLTISEMPSHNHSYTNASGTVEVAAGSANLALSGILSENTGYTGGDGTHNHPLNTDTPNTGNAGGGSAVNNMPPYLAVNVWVRTA